MIVVADTSPLNYLVLIDEVHLLPDLFGQVTLPNAVFQELHHERTPAKVREWIVHLPEWLEVRSVISSPSQLVMRFDPGEREAIQLALEINADIVLIDESEGRQIAEQLHLEVRGTLGVLERGARLGKIDFRLALKKLEETKFRVSPAVREAFLQRNS